MMMSLDVRNLQEFTLHLGATYMFPKPIIDIVSTYVFPAKDLQIDKWFYSLTKEQRNFLDNAVTKRLYKSECPQPFSTTSDFLIVWYPELHPMPLKAPAYAEYKTIYGRWQTTAYNNIIWDLMNTEVFYGPLNLGSMAPRPYYLLSEDQVIFLLRLKAWNMCNCWSLSIEKQGFCCN
jgi:hypothetical protein